MIRKRCSRFTEDVFGWTFKKFEGGPVEYWLVTTGEDKDAGINGGLLRPREGQSAGHDKHDRRFRRLMRRSRKLSRVAEDLRAENGDSQKWAGWLMRKIQPEISLASWNQIRTQGEEIC